MRIANSLVGLKPYGKSLLRLHIGDPWLEGLKLNLLHSRHMTDPAEFEPSTRGEKLAILLTSGLLTVLP